MSLDIGKSITWWNVLACAVLLGTVALLTTTKIVDEDFWWHVAAGEEMWRRGGIIDIDPFAFTREGLPYLATHEWLAQLSIAGAWNLGGATAVILLRTLLVTVTALFVLAMDWRRIWPNVLMVAPAVTLSLGTLRDRPQLSTFALFAAWMFLLIWLLDGGGGRVPWKQSAILLILGILWINLHGAAVAVGWALTAFAFCETLVRSIRTPSSEYRRRAWFLGALSCALVLSAVLPPNGVENLTYFHALLTDDSSRFLREWQPPTVLHFLLRAGPFLAIALAATLTVRRHPLFSCLTLTLLTALGFQAIRHEPLVLLGASAIALEQLRWGTHWQDLLQRILQRRALALVLSVASLLAIALHARSALLRYTAGRDLSGFGTVEPLAQAASFLEREEIEGRAFNAYGDGGYLIWRRYPPHRVFVDGRNVDYGRAFLAETLEAAREPEVWRDLEDRYGLSVAILGYRALLDGTAVPYADHLDRNPAWALVWLDDDAAIYVKRTPAHAALIERSAYGIMTPGLLHAERAPDVPAAQGLLLEAELQRIAAEDSRGIQALLLLGRIALEQGRTEGAAALAARAREHQPHRFEPLELQAKVAAREGRWTDAAALYREAFAIGKWLGIAVNEEALRELEERTRP
jgi:hypothetical protein